MPPRSSGRTATAVFGVVLLIAVGGCSMLNGSSSGQNSTASAAGSSSLGTPVYGSSDSGGAPASPSGSATTVWSGFQAIGMFVPAGPPLHPDFQATEAPFHPSDARPIPSQSTAWMTAKSLGRVALVNGKIVLLDPAVNPLVVPATGKLVPTARTLDVSWTRWIVEPPGRGSDEKGTSYVDRSFWNLCGPGSATVTLYYWQQLTGHPNVTGTAGYFLDPYAAEGVSWPSPGPAVAVSSSGKRLGTYWSGSDRVSGFTAHARGFIMYMATRSQPSTWSATGVAVWADDSGHAYYPTRGASREDIQTGLNWEISGHNAGDWTDAWYGAVNNNDPNLARDLQAAVMLDVGRDGVPVVAAVDTYDLPNWQKGSAAPHTRHAVSIVGYDNTTNPPTYTYIDTCGKACNPRPNNQNGQVHVIAQSKMVASMTDDVGIGFSW